MFFSLKRSGDRNEILQEYRHKFTTEKPDATILLEASPQYLHVGLERASMIREILPGARLLFILRNPVDRLVSYYRSAYGQSSRPSYGLKFEQVVDLGLAGLTGTDQGRAARSFAQEIRMAYYAQYLQEYGKIWPIEQMKIVFFERFSEQVLQEMIEVARYLDLDPQFYERFSFEVENRTRGHRYPALQLAALRVNAYFEPFFVNRARLKRWLRSIYNRLNEIERQIVIEQSALEKLRCHYEPSILQLRGWMAETYPKQVLPSWLT